MKIYTCKFSNSTTKFITAKDLTAAEAEVVAHMEANEILECEITIPTGALSIVRKTGAYHWQHDGYTFGMVQPEQVEKYRAIVPWK